MMTWETIIEKRIKSGTSISKNQIGFMPGKSTTLPAFCVRQIVENYIKRKI